MGKDDDIPEDLIGGKLGIYRLGELIDQQDKSFVFEAREEGKGSPGRDKIAVKVLKPWADRRDQFIKEVQRHGKIGRHPNVATLYFSGYDKGYFFAAMERIKGTSLQRELDEGRTLSLEEKLTIMRNTSGTSQFLHQQLAELVDSEDEEPGHHDLKPGNIIFPKGSKGHVLDFGGRMHLCEDYDDVYALGSILETLIQYTDGSMALEEQRELEQIVTETRRRVYDSPGGLEERFAQFQKRLSRKRTRRRFFVGAGIAAGLAGITLLGLEMKKSSDKKREERKKREKFEASLEYSVQKAVKMNPLSKEFRSLKSEVATRVYYQKTGPLARKLVKLVDSSDPESFPYAIQRGKTDWNLVPQWRWSSGFWPGILWNAFAHTQDEEFKDLAMKWVNKMGITKEDKDVINTLRFYHSHARGFDLTKDKKLYDTAMEASKLLAGRFNPHGNYLQLLPPGETKNFKRHRSYVDVVAALPLLEWAYGKEKDPNLKEIIDAQCEALRFYHLSAEDGSIMQVASFDTEKPDEIRGIKLQGYAWNSCHSRSQARAMQGFLIGYRVTGDERYLRVAEKVGDYFWDNLPPNLVAPYDFEDPDRPNVPEDTSASAAAVNYFRELAQITGDSGYAQKSDKMLHSLITRHLLVNPSHQGILDKGCVNKNLNEYVGTPVNLGDERVTYALNN